MTILGLTIASLIFHSAIQVMTATSSGAFVSLAVHEANTGTQAIKLANHAIVTA